MSDPGTFPQLCLGSDLPLLIPLAGGIMQKGFFLCTKTRSADFPSAGLFILGRHNQHFRRYFIMLALHEKSVTETRARSA